MWCPFRLLAYAALVLYACAGEAQAKCAGTAAHVGDYSNDPCGNPLIENELWTAVKGRVSSVRDGRTIVLTVEDNNHLLRVDLAGISIERNTPFAEQAKALLEKMTLNKIVEVLVNPSRWVYQDKKPTEIIGVLYVPDDAALSLLAQGLVRFKVPPPYTMSHYTQCRYMRAEAEAHSMKSGLWQ